MKLYTEEQVNFAMRYATITKESYKEILKQLIPIEVPSDEEIGLIALNIASTLKDGLDSREEAFYLAGFQTCAKWMKEQILGKEDKTFKQKSKWTEVDNATRRLK
jgi:hypothetical protein